MGTIARSLVRALGMKLTGERLATALVMLYMIRGEESIAFEGLGEPRSEHDVSVFSRLFDEELIQDERHPLPNRLGEYRWQTCLTEKGKEWLESFPIPDVVKVLLQYGSIGDVFRVIDCLQEVELCELLVHSNPRVRNDAVGRMEKLRYGRRNR